MSRRLRDLKPQPGLAPAEEDARVEVEAGVRLLHGPAPPLLRPLRLSLPFLGKALLAALVALPARAHVGLEGVASQLLPGAVWVHAAKRWRRLMVRGDLFNLIQIAKIARLVGTFHSFELASDANPPILSF